jgi:hypothetical protein
MDRVVVVLRVGRIDRHELEAAPVFAPGKLRGLCGIGFSQHVLRKDVRNVVGVNGDKADRLLARQRTEALAHAGCRYAETALFENVDRNEIAVLGAAFLAGRDVERLSEPLLVHRLDAAAAALFGVEDAELALSLARQQFDDAPEIDRIPVRVLFDAEQSAIADARGDLGFLAAARDHDEDFRRRAVFLFVPFGGRREQVAVLVPAGDIGQHDRRQLPGLVDVAAFAADGALVLHLLQHGLQGDLGRAALDAEGTADLTFADLARLFRDKGRDLVFRRQNQIFLR